MRIRLTEHAVRDLELAFEHYRVIDPRLGERFLDDFDAAVGRLVMFPDEAPPVEGFDGVRRARMRRLPDGIFYRHIAGIDLLLVRVLHSHATAQVPSKTRILIGLAERRSGGGCPCRGHRRRRPRPPRSTPMPMSQVSPSS